jgi:hypothetical protein
MTVRSTTQSKCNTHFVRRSKNQFGRWAGTESTLKTEIIDVNMMSVPDPRKFSSNSRERLKCAFRALTKRETKWLIHEFSDPARRELDLAVLEALGATAAQCEDLRARLYLQLHDFYTVARETERQAQKNRAAAARGGESMAELAVKDDWKNSGESEDAEE